MDEDSVSVVVAAVTAIWVAASLLVFIKVLALFIGS